MTDKDPDIAVVDLARDDWQDALLEIASADPQLWQALSRHLTLTLVTGRIDDLAMPDPVDLSAILSAVALLPDDMRAAVETELDDLRSMVAINHQLAENGDGLYRAIQKKLWSLCTGPHHTFISRLLQAVMDSPRFAPQPGDLANMLARMDSPEAVSEAARWATTEAVNEARAMAQAPAPADAAPGHAATLGARVRRLQWTVGLVACCAVVLLGVFGSRAAQAEERARDAEERTRDAQAEASEAWRAARASEARAAQPIEVRIGDSSHQFWLLPATIEVNGVTVTLSRGAAQ